MNLTDKDRVAILNACIPGWIVPMGDQSDVYTQMVRACPMPLSPLPAGPASLSSSCCLVSVQRTSQPLLTRGVVLVQTESEQGAEILSALTARERTDVMRLMSGNLGSASWNQPSAAEEMMENAVGVTAQASKL